jgi:Domain of unknown function (DUF4386)
MAEPAFPAIEPAQQTAARVAGFLYLFTMATANFAEFYARGRLIVGGDAAQTAMNITASERLFRLGIVSNLITFASVVPLVYFAPIFIFEVTLGFWLLFKG